MIITRVVQAVHEFSAIPNAQFFISFQHSQTMRRIVIVTKQLDKRIAQANVVPENLERIPPSVRKRRNNRY